MILPWQRDTPAFAFLAGESGIWIGFAYSRWAIVAGPRNMVGAWVSSAIGERQWIHDRGRWATAGPAISPEGT
jgi:hypothetical protein